MKNYSNHSSEVNGRRSYLDDLFWNHPFAFFTFESLVVIISLVIISTNSLVIRQITKAHKKRKQNINRSDFAIISLSVSDITVGLFSVPLYGIMWYALSFFIEPPFMYSSLITTVIGVDRMFLVRLAQKYENIVTLKALKVIIIIPLLCCLTFGFVIAYIMSNFRLRLSWFFYLSITHAIIIVVAPLVTILAHLYLLNFVLRRGDLKQLRIHHHKNRNSKRLIKTIICICISQLILVFPFSSYLLFYLIDPEAFLFNFVLHLNTVSWLGLLRYCQSFSNAIIILMNQKKQKNSKSLKKEQLLMNDKARMETRL